MEKQSIIKVDIDELHISTENPRIQLVIDEVNAIHEIIFEQGDKIIALIKSIIEKGWMIGELPAVYLENGQYIVYEGNRRISSLKCFFNSELLPFKNKTSDKFKKYINTFSKEEVEELRNKFNKIPVVLHKDKDTIYEYMELRHTPNNGKGDTLERWNTVANERFKNEIRGKKTLVYSVLNEYEKLFNNIEMSQFPITTLERILKNPTVKQKMRFEFKNDMLSVGNEALFLKYLKQIIEDIDKKRIDSRKLSKSQDIINYINQILKGDINSLSEKISDDAIKKDKNQIENQLDLIDGLKNDKKVHENKLISNCNNINSVKREEKVLGNKRTKITIPRGLLFSYLEINNVDTTNPDNFGILYLSSELKELSKSGDYKKYPTSATMLIRSLLEQALKYHLCKIGEWNNFIVQENRKNRNNKEPGLESIINYCNGNTKKIFENDVKVQRSFRIFAKNIGTKDYFDMLIHHPECAVADAKILEKIANNGLYRVIHYIFNNT